MTTIIIAEKPDAAKNIANALAETKVISKTSKYGVDYYEFNRKGKKYIVVAAVGHLFNLKQKGKGWEYPIFDVEWIPSYKARKLSMFSEKYFKTLEDLKNLGSEFIIACDYDNEGSLIGYNILRFIFNKENAKRMKFSTLAKPDLIKSYEEMSNKLDTENIEAGIARHFLDFYYGVNTSRALTLAIKKEANRFAMLSAGRVQGPTLTMLADKEAEIQRFKPKPYWQIELKLLINGKEVIALYEKEKVFDKKEADSVYKDSKGKDPVVKDVTKKEYVQAPPVPFNITSLQTEAYRLFGYSPKQTANIAQDLYTKAYISYPRTSSEKLPPSINNKEILMAISKIDKYKKICEKIIKGKVVPNEGKGNDPAHEAIHPTVEPPKRTLTGPGGKLYDLICRRYLSIFGEPGKRESMKITLLLGKNVFSVTGRRTIEKGWMEYYGPYAKYDEVIFPDLKAGDKLKMKKLEVLSKETSPPPRFSQASIIKEMDKRGLGTRATRAGILDTLYQRDYIVDKSIRVTELGMKIADTLKKYVPDLVDEKLTKKFDKDIENIITKKAKKEPILSKARTAVTKISDEFKKNESKIGKALSGAIENTQNEKVTLGTCSDCGGELKILFSPFSKKKFVGCTGYNKCKICGFSKKACKCKCTICGGIKGKCKCAWKEKIWNPSCQRGYPLPGFATFQKLGKICEKCKTPMIRVIRKGKRPFNMCLAIDCETKKDWGKPGEKKVVKKKAVKKK
ncbi:MAG: DNA topoisomerase I [Candidatus Aenigmarchaeota archaeon]|nr:DNA topoisomerase I [Candidatus Aenigmarchaeota archaeon]